MFFVKNKKLIHASFRKIPVATLNALVSNTYVKELLYKLFDWAGNRK